MIAAMVIFKFSRARYREQWTEYLPLVIRLDKYAHELSWFHGCFEPATRDEANGEYQLVIRDR